MDVRKTSPFKKKLLLLILVLAIPCQLHAREDLVGRLGVGFTNQLLNGLPALSAKLQTSPAWALGLILGFKTEGAGEGLGAGVKVYRYIFDEPNLTFYSSATLAMLSSTIGAVKNSGFEFDVGFGAEFSFQNLESIGFSFEFGVSLSKLTDDTNFSTIGDDFIVGAVHFYL